MVLPSIINDHSEDDDEQPLYHGSGDHDDSEDDDAPLDLSHPWSKLNAISSYICMQMHR